ncbi:MAG TPA: prepilin peptidase [Candidatus Omnitrophica bacterium]|nr:prepilin peptidase [Candidatus Omnitrophota bacterium]
MILALVFIYGAMIGSFLNVCIYRMPREMSVAKPARSFCPECQKQIPWYLNLPLISYLWLRGQCAFCKTKIPLRYFGVELATALMFVGLWNLSEGSLILFVIRTVFMSMIMVVVMTDFEMKFIPDLITFPGMALGLLFSLFPDGIFPQSLWYDRLVQSALGLVGGYGFLFLTALLGNFLFKKESMGGGDLKLMGMMGAFIGLPKIFYVFMLAPFIALPFALWYRAVKKEEQIPFGPFLAFWGAAFFLYGEVLMRYLNKIYGVS